MGSYGVTDRATEGAGYPDALSSLGLIDRRLDNALPDAADAESGSWVARPPILRDRMSDEREGGIVF